MACMASGMTLLANVSMRLCCSHTGQGVEALCVSTPVCIMASNETQDPDYSNSSTTPCGPFFQTSCDSSENLKGRPASVRHLICVAWRAGPVVSPSIFEPTSMICKAQQVHERFSYMVHTALNFPEELFSLS
ncbi:Uncharacterized protein TCM_011868 [Theobroma cacao]|uniref:Uncharacterized protein n=1 Tax=Theobroma cacao TaxID=3641 RepID=A0A061EIM8_THECC|nr:Uncharacterized protein TCM_011868 [Theobroma cacao]